MNLLIRRMRNRASASCGRPSVAVPPTRAVQQRAAELDVGDRRSREPRESRCRSGIATVIERPACSIRAARLRSRFPFFSRSRRPSAICFLRAALSTCTGRAERLAVASRDRGAALVGARVAAEESERQTAEPGRQASGDAHRIDHARCTPPAVLESTDPIPAASPTSDTSSAAARRAPRRRRARDPRSAAGRSRSSDAALQLALRVFAENVVDEQVLGDDRRRLPSRSLR